MEFQAVKGTRDFYPDLMRRRNWICDAWRRVSLRNGFEEYDAPIFECLDLFTIKCGQEIAEDLFSFTDRGGRHLAIRPGITPALARMINARIHSLPRPIKWFSVPRICRAEKPQKGRLREFFQWNVDVIRSEDVPADDVLADAECIFVLVDFLREVGLTPQDVQVRIYNRALTAAHFRAGGVSEDRMEKVLMAQDKRLRLTAEEFEAFCKKDGITPEEKQVLDELEDLGESQEQGRGPPITSIGLRNEEVRVAFEQLGDLFEHLEQFGVGDYCQSDYRIVRGLAYYTGIVYEVFDKAQSLRAIAGGGRYDNLLEMLGGPKVGATGFGMGDVVLGILLEEKGKFPPELSRQSIDFFVIDGEDPTSRQRQSVLKVVGALRKGGFTAEFSYVRRSVGKQLKEANKRGAKKAVIVVRVDTVAVKDLATGRQVEMPMEKFLAKPG